MIYTRLHCVFTRQHVSRASICLGIAMSIFLMNIGAGTLRAQATSPKTSQSAVQAARVQRGGKLTTQELATRSDVVAVGTVAGMQSEWTADKLRIVTRATLRVDEYLKGDAGEKTITVIYPGGEVGKDGEVYSHIASFKRDEEVMIFAGKDQQGNFRVVGGDQGKMTITKDKVSGKKMISTTLSVDDLKAQVKSYLKTQDNK